MTSCSGLVRLAVERGEVTVSPLEQCADPGCPVRHAVIGPLVVEDAIVGTLAVLTPDQSGALVRATDEVALWVSAQLELAQLAASRTRLEAEVRALARTDQPHFIYNSLGAIASFVRTDPDRRHCPCSRCS